MNYEIRTPVLLESVDVLRSVIAGIQDGSMEPNNAGKLISAAYRLQTAVAHDIKARLAQLKIAAYEAKAVEHAEKQQVLESRPTRR